MFCEVQAEVENIRCFVSVIVDLELYRVRNCLLNCIS
jgi:hypothetical protein